MKPQRTVEMKLTQADLHRLRRRTAVCSACGGVFYQEDEQQRVCESCVREALEAEGFQYKENN